jgi:ABC-type uncharacterized transport system substrate-binding protein
LDIVDRNQKGEKLQDIPMEMIKKTSLIINKTTKDMLNIKIPEAILKKTTIVQ